MSLTRSTSRPASRPSSRIAFLCGLTLAVLGADNGLAQSDDEQQTGYREQRAHVHGVGQLNIAVEGDLLLIELISPAMDLLGFEHAPRTEAQRQAIETTRALLQAPQQLFAPTPAAGCVLTATEVDLGEPIGEQPAPERHAHAQDHGHEHELAPAHDDHADIDASYAFDCRQPQNLTELTIGFFDAFPDAQRLQVQLLTETRQHAFELTPNDRRLDF